MIFTLVIGVVVIQLAIGAIQPYLGWIGRTFAIVVIVVLIAGLIAVTVVLIKFLATRFGGGGSFHG